MSKVTIKIRCSDPGCPGEFVKNQKPLAIIGNLVFGAIQSPITISAGLVDRNLMYDSFSLSFQVPTQILAGNLKVYIRYPFLPSRYFSLEKEIEIGASFSATNVILLSTSEGTFQLAIRGTKFIKDPNRLMVRVGNEVFKVDDTANQKGKLIYLSDSLLYLNLNVPPKELSSVNNIIIIQDEKALILPIELKAAAIPTPKPTFHEPFPAINQGDSKTILFKGANFSSLQDVKFEGKTLRFNPKDDGAALEIEITTEVTALKGKKKLTYTLKDGKSDSIEIEVK
jgi:hypothetical protein